MDKNHVCNVRCDASISHHHMGCICWRLCSPNHRMVDTLSVESMTALTRWGVNLKKAELKEFSRMVNAL